MSSRPSLLSQMTGTPLEKPCDVPFDAMSGGDRFRFCAQCRREVWNLSAMTAREAEIRLLNAAEWPCINYRVDGDGRLISREQPRPPTAPRFGLGAAAFVATTLLAPAVASAGGDPPPKSDKTPAPPAKKPAPKSEAARKFNPEDCPKPSPAPAGTTALDAPPQPPLGGAPPPPREQPPSGRVQLKSQKPREVVIDGVSFQAPATIALPPGTHEALVKDGKKTSKRTFEIKLDGTLTLDLDR